MSIEGFAKILLASPSASEFLREAFRDLQSTNSNFTYEKFAAKAGFKSKSHGHLIISGKRTLNLKNVDQVSMGLGLTGQVAAAFKLFVAHEQNPEDREVLRQFELQKKKLSRRSIKPSGSLSPKSPHWPVIFAAVSDRGSSLKEIVRKTRLPDADVVAALHEMIAVGLIRLEGSKYLAGTANVHFEAATESLVFQMFFQKVALRACTLAAANLKRDGNMFFASAVSVRKENLEKFSRDLQKLLSDYTVEIEDAEGDEIALIQAALVTN